MPSGFLHAGHVGPDGRSIEDCIATIRLVDRLTERDWSAYLAVADRSKGSVSFTVSTPYDERFSVFVPFAFGDLRV